MNTKRTNKAVLIKGLKTMGVTLLMLFLGPFLFGILVYNFSPQAGLLAVLALFIVGYLIFQTVYIDKLNYRYILSYLVIVLIIIYELVYLFSPEILNIF